MLLSRLAIGLSALVLAVGFTLGALLVPLTGSTSGEASAAATPTRDGGGDAAARTIGVSGEGEVAVQPDLARVTVGVETSGADLARAQAENASQTQTVLDRLKALGIAERDLQTVGYHIAPQYERDGNTLSGYRVANVVRATVRDLGRLGEIIDAAVAAGANRVHGIAFDISDREDALRRAREAAVQDARTEAEQLARAAGVQLGEVVSIAESGDIARLGMEARAAAAAPGTPIEPGQSTVRVVVQVRYEIR